MVPEVVTYGEYTSHRRSAALINSLMGLFFKIGLALGGIIPGYINAAVGFDGNKATQSAGALNGIVISMIWLPIALALVGMWVMSRYPLTDADVNKMNHELAAQRQKQNL